MVRPLELDLDFRLLCLSIKNCCHGVSAKKPRLEKNISNLGFWFRTTF